MAITGGVAGPTIGIVGPLPPQDTGNTNAVQSISLAGNTAGDTNISGSQIVIAGGNNITLSGDSAAHEIIISAGAAGGTFTEGISNLGNTAGTSGVITGSALQFVLAGGNNVTLSQSTNGASATITISAFNQSNQTEGLYALGNTTGQSSSTTIDARTFSIQGAGAVSVGYSAGSLIISGSGAGAGATQSIGVSNLGNTSGTSGLVVDTGIRYVLVGGNNITLSQSTNANSGTVTISAFNQTNQTVGLYASSQTTGQSSSSTFDARSITFRGAGQVSVGMSAGEYIISATTAAQTNQTIGVYASSQTTGQSSSSTVDARSFTHVGQGIISVGMSAGSLLFSATTTQTNQTVGLYASSQTTGQSSSSTVDARSITFVGGGQVSVGLSGGSYLISATTAAQTNQTIGVYASSQTTGQSSSSTIDARSFTHVGQGIVSVGMSAGSLLISATTVAQTNQTIGLYASSQTTAQSSSSTVDARSITFVGAGQVSVGLSNGSYYISATTAAQTNQTLGEYALGNTTGQSSSTTTDARSLSVAGQGIISVGYSAGSNLIISATQSNQTIGIYASSQTTGQSSSSTVDARSFTHVGRGIVSVGMSGGSLLISATTTQTNQTIGQYALGNTTAQSSSTTTDARSFSVAGQGIISVGYSAGSDLVISATQSVQTIGGYAVQNTTGQSSSTTLDARSLSVAGFGIASVGYSGGSLIVSVPAGGGDGVNIISISGNTAGVATTFISATVALAGGNGITLSQTSNSITISAANQTNQTEGWYVLSQTTGQSSSTTFDARTISLNGAGDVTVGFSAGSVIISGDPFTRAAFIEANYGGM